MLEKFLIEIGLSDKEAKVYLALLKVENDSVAGIAKRTGINRTTVYPLLDSLVEKKLVDEVEYKGKTAFQAISPDRLSTYIKRQKAKINEQENRLDDIIPRLKGISHASGERPIVEIYEGHEEMRKSLVDYFKNKDRGGDMYLIYPRDAVEGTLSPKEVKELRDLRISKKIGSKAIYTYSKGEYQPGPDSHRISDKEFTVAADISVYEDRVRIHSLGKSLNSIYITNKDIADTMKTLFKLAFEALEKRK